MTCCSCNRLTSVVREQHDFITKIVLDNQALQDKIQEIQSFKLNNVENKFEELKLQTSAVLRSARRYKASAIKQRETIEKQKHQIISWQGVITQIELLKSGIQSPELEQKLNELRQKVDQLQSKIIQSSLSLHIPVFESIQKFNELQNAVVLQKLDQLAERVDTANAQVINQFQSASKTQSTSKFLEKVKVHVSAFQTGIRSLNSKLADKLADLRFTERQNQQIVFYLLQFINTFGVAFESSVCGKLGKISEQYDSVNTRLLQIKKSVTFQPEQLELEMLYETLIKKDQLIEELKQSCQVNLEQIENFDKTRKFTRQETTKIDELDKEAEELTQNIVQYLELEIEDLHKQLNEVNNEKQKLELKSKFEIKSLAGDLASAKEAQTLLQAKYYETSDILQAANQEKQQIAQQLAALIEQNRSLQQESYDQELNIVQLKSELEKLQETRKIMKREYTQLQTQLSQQEYDNKENINDQSLLLKQKEQQIGKLRTKLVNQSQQMFENVSDFDDIQNLTPIRGDSRGRLGNIISKGFDFGDNEDSPIVAKKQFDSKLAASVDKSRMKIEQLSQQVSSLQSQIEKIQSSATQTNNANSQFDHLKIMNQQLNLQILQLNAELQSKNSQLHDQKNQMNDLSEQLRNKDYHLLKIRSQSQVLKSEQNQCIDNPSQLQNAIYLAMKFKKQQHLTKRQLRNEVDNIKSSIANIRLSLFELRLLVKNKRFGVSQKFIANQMRSVASFACSLVIQRSGIQDSGMQGLMSRRVRFQDQMLEEHEEVGRNAALKVEDLIDQKADDLTFLDQ